MVARPRQREREQSHNGLAEADRRAVDCDHSLPHDRSAQGSAAGRPARQVICDRDAEQESQSPAPPAQSGQGRAKRDVDRGGLAAVPGGGRNARARLPAADTKQVKPGQRVVQRELCESVDREGQSRAISVHRRNQPPAFRLDPEVPTRAACQETALDRPVNRGCREVGAAETQKRDRTEVQRIVAHADQSERQRADAVGKAVMQAASVDGHLRGDGVFDRHPTVFHSPHKSYLGGVGRVEFTADVKVKCSPGRAFDYFADHRHVAAVLEGVTRWEPIGSKARGVGARYDVEMNAFGFPLKSVLRLNRWQRPEEIGWISESGLIRQEGGFTFLEISSRTGPAVRIVLRIAYEPPASFIGAAIAGRMDWMVRRRLKRALEHIRDVLEAG